LRLRRDAPAPEARKIKEFPMQATWKPHEKHGELTAKGDLHDTVFAFPKQRKEPMTDAKHVRNAVARFDQVEDVSDEERTLAFANIKKAAEHYDVELTETSWRDLGVHPQAHRKEAAAKALKTKRARGTVKKAAATATRKR
jgi:hypothetical protein